MLVTRQGFEAAAVELEKSLETCAFAAIDCEMTGIMGDDSTRPLLSDTPGERYKKCAKVATRFQLMQVGVCPFHASEDGKSFTGTPFTFYVLPDAKANAPVHMLTSTVAFHAGCDFDFNAWLKGGIPYLSEAAYAGLAEKLARSDEPREGEKRERVVISSEADRAFFNAAISDLRAWLARCGDGGEAEFMLPECNAFLRRAFYEELEAAFPECVVESRMVADDPPPPPPPPPPTALSSEAPPAPPAPPSEAETAAETAKTAEAKPPTAEGLEERSGFLRLWRTLCGCGKPVIVHNGFYDLLFLHAAFEGPLPPSVRAFKQAMTSRMGDVRDTKILACDSGLISPSDTMLAPLHAALSKLPGAPPCSLGANCSRYEGSASEHEAGYDAYLTGCCFAILRSLGHAPLDTAGRMHLNNSAFALKLHDFDGDARAEPDACILHLQQAPSAAAPPAAHAPSAQPVRTRDVLAALQPLKARPLAVSACTLEDWLDARARQEAAQQRAAAGDEDGFEAQAGAPSEVQGTAGQAMETEENASKRDGGESKERGGAKGKKRPRDEGTKDDVGGSQASAAGAAADEAPPVRRTRSGKRLAE